MIACQCPLARLVTLEVDRSLWRDPNFVGHPTWRLRSLLQGTRVAYVTETFHLQNYRTCVLLSSGVRTPESNLRSPNYRGRKSELCVLGIEKRPLFLERPPRAWFETEWNTDKYVSSIPQQPTHLSSEEITKIKRVGFFFFCYQLFFILFFSHTTQHNIQNTTKQNNRHILNISKSSQKGGGEGRTTRTQKLLLYIITYIQQKNIAKHQWSKAWPHQLAPLYIHMTQFAGGYGSNMFFYTCVV